MQSKNKIQQLLTSEEIYPKKRLSQHFLIDLNLMKLLVSTANINQNDVVLEVGPATGSLTQALSEKAGAVVAVEIDPNLAKIAKKQLADKKNVQIINADILQKKSIINFDVTDTLKSLIKKLLGRFLLVANLPYNVASPLILNLVTGSPFADAMYVTVQEEVAERITAKPGTKQYGTLSILLTAAGDVKIERILPPSVFWPRPKVNSAMLSFIRSREKIKKINNINILNQTINIFLKHRRKMLKSIIKLASNKLKKNHNWQQIFETCRIDANQRPDQLTVESYIKIANRLS